MRQAARWEGTGGALCIREKVQICVLVKRKEEPGREQEYLDVATSARGWGFPPSSLHRHLSPKCRVQRRLSTDCK